MKLGSGDIHAYPDMFEFLAIRESSAYLSPQAPPDMAEEHRLNCLVQLLQTDICLPGLLRTAELFGVRRLYINHALYILQKPKRVIKLGGAHRPGVTRQY